MLEPTGGCLHHTYLHAGFSPDRFVMPVVLSPPPPSRTPGDEGAEECAVCLSPLEGAIITTCGHLFCRR